MILGLTLSSARIYSHVSTNTSHIAGKARGIVDVGRENAAERLSGVCAGITLTNGT